MLEENTKADCLDTNEISRREALAKMAKFSAYAAPTVVTLLASRSSMAQLASCAPGVNNANHTSVPGADQSAADNMDTTADCGIDG